MMGERQVRQEVPHPHSSEQRQVRAADGKLRR
jgi:hypothetical protein